MLRKARQAAKRKKYTLYIVGGFLRDFILKREKELKDFDFCLKKGALVIAKELAKDIKGAFVILDKERGIARVVYTKLDKKYSLDFNDFRAGSLEKDLQKRDFTINAFAVKIDDFLNKDFQRNIIDPFGGLVDLRKKIIRVFSKETFIDDPLRILRAFSLKAQLGFKIEPKTIALAKALRKNITNAASERIRDEVIKILSVRESEPILKEFFNLSILEVVIPEVKKMHKLNQGPYHHLDVLGHSFETLRQLEILIKSISVNSDLHNYLQENVSGDHKRFVLLKLAAFLHDIGKPEAKRLRQGKIMFHGHERRGVRKIRLITERLKLSSKESEILERVIMWHLRPGYLADLEPLTERAVYRFFRDAKDEVPGILLLGIADQRSTCGPLTAGEDRLHHEKVCSKLISIYFKKKKEKPFIPLINGHDLIKNLKLKEGPLIGKILKKVNELQAIGKIKTKDDALIKAATLAKIK